MDISRKYIYSAFCKGECDVIFKALMFDTRSIQRYIFTSNRLKTNIGASALVDQVFQEKLLAVLRKVFEPEQVDAETWEKVDAPNWEQMPMRCRIGYIGGGNAFVLFQEDVQREELQKAVTAFTKELLCSHPGLRTGVAYGLVGLDKDGCFLTRTVRRWRTATIRAILCGSLCFSSKNGRERFSRRRMCRTPG
jgi:hypothetical protein